MHRRDVHRGLSAVPALGGGIALIAGGLAIVGTATYRARDRRAPEVAG
jgi:hypothetical protein